VLGVWDFVLTASPEEMDERITSTARMITAPYLAIHGIDPGDEYATWLKDVMPGATLEVWPDIGHYPHLVEPARFVRRVEEFSRA
jgi:pimeloyl-ACP methyl ester carboxylesterase